ncbi:hypothetical protein U8548_004143 [Salmonella enterica]|uniref:hypothetical protein n=1 Tax=Citrobacter portucalensis TaxID=1639133 RepID=UPI002AD091A1|nr:hypothetical protein [Salmonella enterica]
MNNNEASTPGKFEMKSEDVKPMFITAANMEAMPFIIRFQGGSELKFDKEKVTFTGDADDAAKQFIEHVANLHNHQWKARQITPVVPDDALLETLKAEQKASDIICEIAQKALTKASDEDSDYFTTARLMEIIYGSDLKWPEQKLLARYMLDMKNRFYHSTEGAEREILKRLAVIMCGNDSPGEIRSLTVTAQSLVDRCKALARQKENGHIQWKPASPDEIKKRRVREPTDTHIPSREAIIAGGILVQCPRCHGDSYRLNFNGWDHHWCDKCTNAITSEGK